MIAHTRQDHARAAVLTIFAPFVLGYFLSYLFRNINASLASRFTAELGLDAADLGALTSAYFCSFALAQIPVGIALDRFGPRRVQIGLLSLAALGAVIFASATSYSGLLLGRTLIGLGSSAALMAGLKAIVLWLPAARAPTYNGMFVATGALGAVTATLPVELAASHVHWRSLFMALAVATVLVAMAIAWRAPDCVSSHAGRSRGAGIGTIAVDPRFWRLAPISFTCIGGAWAIQGLWVGPWLKDVAGFTPHAASLVMMTMAVALCLSALLLGMAATSLSRRGVSRESILAGAALALVAAEIALASGAPIAPVVPFACIAAFSAGTVLLYSIVPTYFPTELSARANSLLNVFNIGGAFAIQAGFGAIVSLWPADRGGHYPAGAYHSALAILVVAQVVAIAWLLRPAPRLGREAEPAV